MASAGPPPLSADGLWFWDGSGWRSLVSTDGQKFWDGKAWVYLPPSLAGQTLQPPSVPPPGVAAAAPPTPTPLPPPPAYSPHPPASSPPPFPPPSPPAGAAQGPLPSPPGYAPPPPAPVASPPQEVEPRPNWLPADAPWPPATFTASPSVPLTSDTPLAPPAQGAVPWANVYSNVIASSTATHGYSYAGFWVRFIAYLIDSLIVGIPFLLIYFAIVAGGGGSAQDVTQASTYTSVFNLLGAAISFGYFVYFWTLGSTPGMRLMGIRVADQTTFRSIGLGKAVLRYIGLIVASFCCSIGLIWAAFDSHKQGWHDKIGGTVVVHR